MDREIKKDLLILLQPKLERFGISPKEMKDSFDLVKSGFVNSLEFVELVTSLEKQLKIEVDFEKALESSDFTTFGGLITILETYIHD